MERRTARALTQKYDIQSLRAIQKLEGDFNTVMATKWGCSESDLPVEVDILEIFNAEPETRRATLEGILKDAPFNATTIIDDLLRDLSALDHGHASDSAKK